MSTQAFDTLRALPTEVVVPVLMLLSMFGVFVWVLWRAQRREDFDAAQFLHDDAGRLSSVRLFAFLAVAVHSWVIAVETVSGRITPDMTMIYAATWSGSLVLAEAVKKWNGTLPWAKV